MEDEMSHLAPSSFTDKLAELLGKMMAHRAPEVGPEMQAKIKRLQEEQGRPAAPSANQGKFRGPAER